MSVARNVICFHQLTGLFPSEIHRAATVVDGVDEAAQLESYSVADRQPMQLDQGRRDVLEATQAEHQSGSCILDMQVVAATWTLVVPPTRCYSSPAWTL